MSIKRFSSFFIRFGLSFALLAWLFSKIDRQKTLEVFQSADAGLLLLALAVFLFNNVILLARWMVVMRGLKLKVSFFESARSYFIGLFGNLFLPSSIGGDILKAYTLCKHSKDHTKVVASVLLDRLSGFAGIVIMALASFAIGYKMINKPALILPVVILGCVSVAAALVLFNRSAYGWMCGVVNAFPKFKEKLMAMHDDIALLKASPRHGLGAIAISIAGQMSFILVFFLIAKSLGQNVSIGYFCVFVPLICVISMIPSIGGLGVREMGSVQLFASAGVASEAAVSMSLMVFVFMVIVGLIGGLVYVITLYPRRIQHPSQTSVS